MEALWYILGFAFAGVSFVFLTIGAAWLVSHRNRGDVHKGLPYESGIDTYGDTHGRFGLSFYIYALLFVAFDIEDLQVTYDIADGVTNPANVRLNDADLDGTGACAPDPCSPNQVRKINILLAGRSRQPMRGTNQFFRNRLVTQVSLRSLSFVDRYQ